MIRQAILAALTCSVAALSAQAQEPSSAAFEVASVRPNTGSDLNIPVRPHPPDGITYVNVPLDSLIRYAYQVQSFRLLDLPRWPSTRATTSTPEPRGR